MIPITTDDLRAVCPRTNLLRLQLFLEPVNLAMAEYAIDTPKRQTAFLPQIAHESGGLLYVREIWGPTPAQKAYEPPSRKAEDLGNTQAGDGYRYRGRGLIQITGRANYRDAGLALNLPLEGAPEALEEPINAARSAAWFWASHGLNDLAEADDFEGITRRINGGFNGQAERVALWEAAKAAMLS